MKKHVFHIAYEARGGKSGIVRFESSIDNPDFGWAVHWLKGIPYTDIKIVNVKKIEPTPEDAVGDEVI